MAEYINREKLMNDLHNHYECRNAKQNAIMDEVCMIAFKQPTADVVPVVRCCNCIHLTTNTSKENYCNKNSTTWDKFYVRLNDYCSYGERKDK